MVRRLKLSVTKRQIDTSQNRLENKALSYISKTIYVENKLKWEKIQRKLSKHSLKSTIKNDKYGLL